MVIMYSLFLFAYDIVIVHPDQFQIISTTPKGDVERTLVLIGKVLQKLSNEREFGSDGKGVKLLNLLLYSEILCSFSDT